MVMVTMVMDMGTMVMDMGTMVLTMALNFFYHADHDGGDVDDNDYGDDCGDGDGDAAADENDGWPRR